MGLAHEELRTSRRQAPRVYCSRGIIGPGRQALRAWLAALLGMLAGSGSLPGRPGCQPTVGAVGPSGEETAVDQSLQQAGAGLCVEAPKAARLLRPESEAGHLEIFPANTTEDLVLGYSAGGLVHARPSGPCLRRSA